MIINTLRQTPYQLIALTKLLNNKQNAILITDGVGVGKTISAGYIASYFSKTPSGPIIVACPNILVDKWREDYFGALFPLNPSSIIPKGESLTTIINN